MLKIKELREKNKLSVIQLSRLMGVTRATIYYWENGRSTPTFENTLSLAKIFGVPVEELQGDSHEES